MSFVRVLMTTVGLFVVVWASAVDHFEDPVLVVFGAILMAGGEAWDEFAHAIGHTRPNPKLLRQTEQDRLLGEVQAEFFKLDLSEDSVAWLEGETDRVLRHGRWHAWQGPVLPRALESLAAERARRAQDRATLGRQSDESVRALLARRTAMLADGGPEVGVRKPYSNSVLLRTAYERAVREGLVTKADLNSTGSGDEDARR